MAHDAGALSVVDASGAALAEALKARPGLVKPNRMELAATIGRELKEVNPQYSFSEHFARQPYQNKHDVQRIAEGLAKAGLISCLRDE